MGFSGVASIESDPPTSSTSQPPPVVPVASRSCQAYSAVGARLKLPVTVSAPMPLPGETSELELVAMLPTTVPAPASAWPASRK